MADTVSITCRPALAFTSTVNLSFRLTLPPASKPTLFRNRSVAGFTRHGPNNFFGAKRKDYPKLCGFHLRANCAKRDCLVALFVSAAWNRSRRSAAWKLHTAAPTRIFFRTSRRHFWCCSRVASLQAACKLASNIPNVEDSWREVPERTETCRTTQCLRLQRRREVSSSFCCYGSRRPLASRHHPTAQPLGSPRRLMHAYVSHDRQRNELYALALL